MLYQQRVIQGVAKRWPGIGRQLVRATPAIIQQQCAKKLLNKLLDKPLLNHELDFFAGKTLNLQLTDIGLHLGIHLADSKLQVGDAHNIADVRLAAASKDLLLIAAQAVDVDRLFFQRRLHMSGDTELGLEIKNLLASQDLSELLPPLWLGRLKKITDYLVAAAD